MSEPTPGPATGLGKRKLSPGAADEHEDSSREPKRLRLCLRAFTEALAKWRMRAEDLVFPDDIQDRKGGGTADVAKATISSFKSIHPDDQSSGAVEDVAVKKFRFGGDIDKRAQVASFANELCLLSELKHNNVVQLIGFVENVEEGIAWILLSWEDNGNLREFIHSQDWVIPERVSLLNILVTSQNRAAITDFGSARKLERQLQGKKDGSVPGPTPPVEPVDTKNPVGNQESSVVKIAECGTFITLTGPAYTLRWAAPELLNEQPLTLASDMWAVAWICWEIMTGKLPFDDICQESLIVLSVVTGELPPVTSNGQISQLRALCAIMTRCWSMNPVDRPTSGECSMTIGWMVRLIERNLFVDLVANTHSQGRIAPTRRNAAEGENYTAEVLCALGYVSVENQETDKAALYFEQALELARSVPNELAAANALMGQGTVQGVMGQYYVAKSAYTEAKAIYTRLGAQKGVADAFWALGQVYRFQRQIAKAKASYTEAGKLYSQLGAAKGVAHAFWALGKVLLGQHQYSEAEAYYIEAKKTYSQIGAGNGFANTTWELGEMYRLQHRYWEAKASYIEAQVIYSCLGAEMGVASAACGLGDVYGKMGNYSNAETQYHRAEELYVNLRAETGVANVAWGLAELYRLQNEFLNAEAQYRRARELYARLGLEKQAADAAWALGTLYRSLDKFTKAEASYIEAKELYTRLGAKELADVARELGEIYRSHGEYSNAEASYTDAQNAYTRFGDEQNAVKVGCVLAYLYRLQGEYPKAEALDVEVKEVYANLGAERDVAAARCRLGQVYRLQGEYFKAEASYIKAKKIYSRLGAEKNVIDVDRILGDIYRLQDAHIRLRKLYRIGAERDAVDAHCRLGQGYRQQGEYFKAEMLYTEAKKIYTRLGAEKDVAKAGFILGDIYLSQDQYSNAEALYVQAKMIYARLGYEGLVAKVGGRLTKVCLLLSQHSIE
ncbi:hypothetical protein FRC01_013910 [Tulasnella sp. 417]|nr:hypothetical protein FRC01_013910 [Tulasnella sp. 417]